jgi:hypothetical protein
MDLAGIGDSDTRAGRPDDEVFPPAALADIRAAMEFVQARYGIRDITLAGPCSGAYHALRAAVAGLPVNCLLMVNPENFFSEEGASVRELQLAEVVRNPSLYRERAFSPEAWKRLLSGQVSRRRVSWRDSSISNCPAIWAVSLKCSARATCVWCSFCQG